MANLPKLNKPQFQALKDTQLGQVVEIDFRKQLMNMGLITQKLGGWALTDLGKRVLATGWGAVT